MSAQLYALTAVFAYRYALFYFWEILFFAQTLKPFLLKRSLKLHCKTLKKSKLLKSLLHEGLLCVMRTNQCYKELTPYKTFDGWYLCMKVGAVKYIDLNAGSYLQCAAICYCLHVNNKKEHIWNLR